MRIASLLRSTTIALALLVAALATPSAQARVDIRIDLSSQTMLVIDARGAVHRWAISSGRSGYRTPSGVYSSQRLARMHYSSKYDNSPMPHSIFFSGGYAIHGTGAVRMLGRPASHGCIRLAPAHAAKLFAMVRRSGARIAIGNFAPGDFGRAYAGAIKKRAIAQAQVDEPATVSRTRTPAAAQRGGDVDHSQAPASFWTIDGRGAPRFSFR